MSTDHLVLKRATDHRAGREDYDVLNVGRVVGRIYETVRASREVAWCLPDLLGNRYSTCHPTELV